MTIHHPAFGHDACLITNHLGNPCITEGLRDPAACLDPALFKNHDMVGESNKLIKRVGDVEGRNFEFAMQPLKPRDDVFLFCDIQ